MILSTIRDGLFECVRPMTQGQETFLVGGDHSVYQHEDRQDESFIALRCLCSIFLNLLRAELLYYDVYHWSSSKKDLSQW